MYPTHLHDELLELEAYVRTLIKRLSLDYEIVDELEDRLARIDRARVVGPLLDRVVP